MNTNMAKTDRVLPLAIAAALMIAAFGTATFASGILFGSAPTVAAVFTLTVFAGTCPLFRVIGPDTCEVRG